MQPKSLLGLPGHQLLEQAGYGKGIQSLSICSKKITHTTVINERVQRKNPCYIQHFNFTAIGERNLFVKLNPTDKTVKRKLKMMQDLPPTTARSSHLQFLRDKLVEQDNFRPPSILYRNFVLESLVAYEPDIFHSATLILRNKL